jgi:hypothetical protein
MGQSSKRESKKPQWLDEGVDPDEVVHASTGRKDGVKNVFVLMAKDDVNKTLVGREVYTLWPDNGRWYKGKVTKCNPAEMTAMLFYQETNEKEEADLREMIDEKQIAFCTYVCLCFFCESNVSDVYDCVQWRKGL